MIEVRTPFRKSIGIFAILFGLGSLMSGGGAIFGGEATKSLAGNVVPFVVWFNFLGGVAYIVAGAGIYAARGWATPLSAAIAAASLVVLGLFGLKVLSGAAYEMRTVWAMSFRCVVWLGIAFVACRACRQARALAA